MGNIFLLRRERVDEGFTAISKIISHLHPSLLVLPMSLKDNKCMASAVQASASLMQKIVSEPSDTDASIKEGRTSSGCCATADKIDWKENDSVKLRFVATQEFTHSRASQHIRLISLPGMPVSLTSRERLSFITHLLDADNETAFRAAGGLLHFLIRENVVAFADTPDASIILKDIEHITHFNVLYMTRGTMRALQVFDAESHPLSYGCGRAKEGLSLFGILSKTRSSLGGPMLQSWVECPSTDIKVITERQNMIRLLQSPSYESISSTLHDALRHVRNVPAILHRIRAISASLGDWRSLQKSAAALLLVMETIISSKELVSTSRFFDNGIPSIDVSGIRQVRDWITAVIDFSESTVAGRPVVASGFSEDIDKMRDCYAGLDDLLTSIGIQEMNRIAEESGIEIPRLQFVYLPQGRSKLLALAHKSLSYTHIVTAISSLHSHSHISKLHMNCSFVDCLFVDFL